MEPVAREGSAPREGPRPSCAAQGSIAPADVARSPGSDPGGREGRWGWAFVAVLGWWAAWQALALWAFDLRDLPGPGGLALLMDLVEGRRELGLTSALGHGVAAFAGDPILAARLLDSGAVALAMCGLLAVGEATLGWRPAAMAGLLAVVWIPAASLGWLLGPDCVAWGLAWGGLGLASQGARRGGWGAVALGAAIVVTAAAAKASALATAPYLLLVPWIARGLPGHGRLWVGIGLFSGLALGVPLLLALTPGEQPLLAGVSGSAAAAGGEDLPVAMRLLALGALPQKRLGFARLPVAWMLAGGALLFGGRRRGTVLVLLLLAAVGQAATALAAGDSLLPRYLVPGSLGLLLAAGATLTSPAPWRRPPWLRLELAGAVILGLAALDLLAFAHAWDRLRHSWLDLAPARLPPAPEAWVRAHDLPEVLIRDCTEAGILDLDRLLAERPPRGLVVVPLRDDRHRYVEIRGVLAGVPVDVLVAKDRCGRAEPLDTCARRAVRHLASQGAWFVLPGDEAAVPPPLLPWTSAVREALGERAEPARLGARWLVWR